MFRFLHAADIHLDSPLRGLSRYEGAPAEAIRAATRRAFENLVDLAIEEEVAFLLLAGDLYDGDWKDFNTGIFMSRQIGRLAARGIQVVAVSGNHDAASRITKALELPANMRILSSRRPETLVFEEPGVAIHGQSFASPREERNLAVGFPAARPGLFNIGLLHTSLDGRAGHADYAPCVLDDLRARGYDYWALGHVHQHEVVARDPWVVFPGCLQGRHARETGPKGATLVSVDDDGAVVAAEPRALDLVRWARCSIDLQGADGLPEVLDRARQAMQRALDAAEERLLAMRVRFFGSCSIADVLLARREWLLEQVRATAAELGDQVWIEKLELDVQGQRDLDAILDEGGPFASLLETILASESSTRSDARSDPDLPRDAEALVPGLAEVLAELTKKLPLEARSGEGAGLDLSEPGKLGRIVDDARRLLVGRLLSAGPGGEA